MEPIVCLKDYSYAYPQTDRFILDKVNMEIGSGQCHCLTGPTGSGKSTLVLAMKDLLPPGRKEGEIYIPSSNGNNRTGVGIVMQNPETQLLCSTVGAEVAFGLENLCIEPELMPEKVQFAISSLGLSKRIDNNVDNLSMGQKYRLLLSSLLVMDPKLLVLDEPGAQLDPQGIGKLTKVIANLKKKGISFLICENNPLPLKKIIDTYWRMDNGTLVRCENFTPPVLIQGSSIEPEKFPLRNNELVLIKDLYFAYHNSDSVLNGLSLSLYEGQRAVVTGRNGSGKSTLLHCLAGFLKPSRGEVLITDRKPKPNIHSGKVGYLFQNPTKQLFEDTVFDEIAFTLKRIGMERDRVESRVKEVLEFCRIDGLAMCSPFKLSYGQQHLVVLASILAPNPKLVLLDDPFTGLDPEKFKFILDLLLTFSEEKGTAIFLTSHNPFEHHYWAHLIMQLEGGRLVPQ